MGMGGVGGRGGADGRGGGRLQNSQVQGQQVSAQAATQSPQQLRCQGGSSGALCCLRRHLPRHAPPSPSFPACPRDPLSTGMEMLPEP